MVQQLSTNTFGTAKWIVSATASDGTHTTIASAITSASSGDTIFIRPGTYTENLTLKVGVNLCAYGPSMTFASNASTIPNVIINGTCTLSTAGTVGIDGICLQTNSAPALVVSGSVASVVILNKCFINCSNNTGITFSSSSASSIIELNYCGGDLGTTGIALFSHSSAGNLRFLYSIFSNTGTSLTANTVSGSGNLFPNFSSWTNGTTISSTATVNGTHCNLTMAGNQTAITYNSTTIGNLVSSTLASGTSSPVSIGTGANLNLNDCFLSSSNATTVTGSGTFTYNNISSNSAFAIGTSIIPVPYPGTSSLRFIQSITASNSATISFTQGFGQFSSYLVIFKEIQPVTNATTLGMQVSSNGGVSYSNSGYQSGINTNAYNTATLTNANSTTNVLLSGATANAGGGGTGASGYFYFTTNAATVVGSGVYYTGTTFNHAQIVAGLPVTPNAIQFSMSSGNINIGVFSLYGITS